jgi:hypothetical protein
MKVYFFCSFFLCFISANIFSQAIKAEIKYVFIDDENAGKYTGGIHIDAGHINVGDKLMPIDENGVQYNFEVISIEDNDLNASVESLGTGKDGFIVLQTPDKKKLNKKIAKSVKSIPSA